MKYNKVMTFSGGKSLKQVQQDVFNKLFVKDENGELKRTNERLSLEETAVALAIIEGQKQPFSRMCMSKYEKGIMLKLREGLKGYGITNFADVFVAKDRTAAPSNYVPVAED